jgi:hypothetical protein
MGFACDLRRIGAIQYSLDVGNGLVEREYLHLFVGSGTGSLDQPRTKYAGGDGVRHPISTL